MLQGDGDAGEDLQKLTLQEILEREDCILEEILSVRDIHAKIKRQMKVFIDYCRRKEPVADRLIALGLKCPMHESTNPSMKTISYIAADILTSDHESLADLLILPVPPSPSSDDDPDEEIAEEIETEDGGPGEASQQDKYKYLVRIWQYFDCEMPDENCLNYIGKSLQTLIRKKLSEFLEFFSAEPERLKKLVRLAHYPSVAHLLAKIVTDDEENLSKAAQDIRTLIIPLLIEKIHAGIGEVSNYEVLESVEEILQGSRYGEVEERSQLQKLSDMLVASQEVAFHVEAIRNSLLKQQKQQSDLATVSFAVGYLGLIVARMNMDEQQDYNDQPQQFKPNLNYQLDQLFLDFGHFFALFPQLHNFSSLNPAQSRLLSLRFIELLLTISKHSRFGGFYARIPKAQRLGAIRMLVERIARKQFAGVLLQMAATLTEKMILEEEKLAEIEGIETIEAGELYALIKEEAEHLGVGIREMGSESTRQRNQNEAGIYLRKLLVLVDNFFKNEKVAKQSSKPRSLTEIFPSFSVDSCRKYAEVASIENHPGGPKVKPVEEFAFIRKSKDILKDLVVDEVVLIEEVKPVEIIETQVEEVKVVEVEEVKVPEVVAEVESRQKKAEDVLSNLSEKIKTYKGRIKEKSDAEELVSPVKKEAERAESASSPLAERQSKANELGSHFFVRHLSIY